MSTPIDTIALLNRIRDLEAEVAAHEREREALNASWHSRCLRTEIRAEAAEAEVAVLKDCLERAKQLNLEYNAEREAAEAEVARLHHEAHRWNVSESEGVLQICRGGHERGTDCEYERWVPEAEVARLKDASSAYKQGWHDGHFNIGWTEDEARRRGTKALSDESKLRAIDALEPIEAESCNHSDLVIPVKWLKEINDAQAKL